MSLCVSTKLAGVVLSIICRFSYEFHIVGNMCESATRLDLRMYLCMEECVILLTAGKCLEMNFTLYKRVM